MKIALVAAMCNNGRTCPNVNVSDHGTVVIQGYEVAPQVADTVFQLGDADGVVEIPLGLLPNDLVAAETRTHRTERGTLLVVGRRVAETEVLMDAEALTEVMMPPGEAAVEVAAATKRVAAHVG